MYKIAEYINRPRRMSTAIMKNPSGAKIPFSIVGSVPLLACNHAVETGNPKAWYQSEEEAKARLIEIGLPFFQLANCSWYPYKPESKEDIEKLAKWWKG